MNRARLFDDQKSGDPLPDLREVLAAQLRAALADGEEHIAKSLEALIAVLMGLDELDNRCPNDRELVASLKHSAGALVEQLQFYDAHSQRITHVAETMISSTQVVPMSSHQNTYFLDELEKRYTCEAECEVHQTMLYKINDESCSSSYEGD